MRYADSHYPRYTPTLTERLSTIAYFPLLLAYGSLSHLSLSAKGAVRFLRDPKEYRAGKETHRREMEQRIIREDADRQAMLEVKRAFLAGNTRPYNSFDEMQSNEIVLSFFGKDHTRLAPFFAFEYHGHRELPLDTKRSKDRRVLVMKKNGMVERLVEFDVDRFYEGILELDGSIGTEDAFIQRYMHRFNQRFEALANTDVFHEKVFHKVTSPDLTARIGSAWAGAEKSHGYYQRIET